MLNNTSLVHNRFKCNFEKCSQHGVEVEGKWKEINCKINFCLRDWRFDDEIDLIYFCFLIDIGTFLFFLIKSHFAFNQQQVDS
jgi:hypothetical protein